MLTESSPMLARMVLAVSLLSSGQQSVSRPPEPKPWLHFTVDGNEWKILRTQTILDGEPGATAMAYSDYVIRVRLDVPEKDLGETVMHEVMHALSFRDGAFHDPDWNNSDDRDDTCDGHCGIYHMTPKLLDLMANNPELMAFFKEHGKR